jgi:ketosteroid isomerase-like protein
VALATGGFADDAAHGPRHDRAMPGPFPRSPLAIAASLAMSLAACATAPPPIASTDPAAGGNLDRVLRAQTQEMLDAVAAGDTKVWDRYLDPQMLYLSEAGEVETKAQLLDELKPLPPGISGHIAISRFEVRPFGDTAVVLHVDEETENYFGHEIHAQYMNTATWRRASDGWKLIAQQVIATLADPPAIALSAAQLDDYAGNYRLTDEIHYAIRRDGDHLVGERTGRPPQALRIEARDVAFVPGQPRSRKVFQRDAGGRITGFADRREGRDIVWTRQ